MRKPTNAHRAGAGALNVQAVADNSAHRSNGLTFQRSANGLEPFEMAAHRLVDRVTEAAVRHALRVGDTGRAARLVAHAVAAGFRVATSRRLLEAEFILEEYADATRP